MKHTLRWQVLLAVIGFSLILSILSFQAQTTELCATQVPATGGVFVEGIVGTPQVLNPLLSDTWPVDRQLVSLIFDGLTRYDETGRLAPGLAQSWSVSQDGLSIRFVLPEGLTWHDGEPVTAADVVFTYGLMQDDAFPGSPALKTLWQSVDIVQIDDHTVEFVLEAPYAPFLDATTRGILPAHLFSGVTAVSLADHPFNQSPIGTGPWMVEPGQDWRQTRRLRLIPNPLYWRQGTQLSAIEFRLFPDDESMISALKAGEIHAVNTLSADAIPTTVVMPGVRLFTATLPRYTMLMFNQSDTGMAALQQIEVRKALAYALDREALVHEVLNGQGVPLEGPYLPTSWAYNLSQLTLYQTNILSATAFLDQAGWVRPEGQLVRQREEEALTLRLVTLDNAIHQHLAQAIAAQWADVGVAADVETTASINALRQILAGREFDVALVDVAPPGDPDLYDFWSQEAIIRGQNYASWNNRRASEALENGRQVWGVAARRPYYNTFLRIYDNDLPALTLYQHVYTYALSSDVKQAEIGRIANARERYESFAEWFLLYRDVTVACSE